MNSSSMEEEEEQAHARSMLLNNVEGTFKPAVRVVIAHEKAAALVSIRRSNSTGTELQLLHPSYVVDSEGTQHNRNYQTHTINVEEFLLEDQHGAQSWSTQPLPRHPGSLAEHNWLPRDLETGDSSVIQPNLRSEPQQSWLTISRLLNLRHFARTWKFSALGARSFNIIDTTQAL